MKGRKKFYTYFSLIAAAVYIALVVILYCSESSHAGSEAQAGRRLGASGQAPGGAGQPGKTLSKERRLR